MRPLSYRDVEALLIRLGDSSPAMVLIGGQAVNFWAEQYSVRAPEIGAQAHYASKDVDFCGTRAAVVECARRLGGRPLLPADFEPTPSSGQVIFVDSAGTECVISCAPRRRRRARTAAAPDRC